jgi:hypothetical protein
MPKKNSTPVDMSDVELPKHFTIGDDDGKKKVHTKQCMSVSSAFGKDNDVKFDSVTEKNAGARACGHCSK